MDGKAPASFRVLGWISEIRHAWRTFASMFASPPGRPGAQVSPLVYFFGCFSMYADFVMQDPVFFDLCARAKFRITGTDRFRFLNGQITNDLRKSSETAAIEACVLNAKGKLNAHIFVGALGESFLVDAETGVREKLRARLERYIIADDVEIQDGTN